MTTWTTREAGSGVPALPWRVRLYGQYGDYEGHAFVTADPTGMGRSVCDGFIDDMEWVVSLHNRVIGNGWRARLARRLLNLRIAAGEATVRGSAGPASNEGSDG